MTLAPWDARADCASGSRPASAAVAAGRASCLRHSRRAVEAQSLSTFASPCSTSAATWRRRRDVALLDELERAPTPTRVRAREAVLETLSIVGFCRGYHALPELKAFALNTPGPSPTPRRFRPDRCDRRIACMSGCLCSTALRSRTPRLELTVWPALIRLGLTPHRSPLERTLREASSRSSSRPE